MSVNMLATLPLFISVLRFYSNREIHKSPSYNIIYVTQIKAILMIPRLVEKKIVINDTFGILKKLYPKVHNENLLLNKKTRKFVHAIPERY